MGTSVINTCRRQVYVNVYTKRTNGLFNLTDSLLTTTQNLKTRMKTVGPYAGPTVFYRTFLLR